ncbi:MAG: TrbC/VirB2 family protein [Rickettsiales bacterium]|nr:TrbC/VirB2 family protein [Rickettsiales bacterium]
MVQKNAKAPQHAGAGQVRHSHRAFANTHRQGVWMAALMVAALLALTPSPAFAGTPMGEVLCYVLYIIMGNAGRGMATIGMSVLGISAILGKASWGLAITVGVGIAVIFGCMNIVWVLGLGEAVC